MTDRPKGIQFEGLETPEQRDARLRAEIIHTARHVVHALTEEKGPRFCAGKLRSLANAVYELDGEKNPNNHGLDMQWRYWLSGLARNSLRHLVGRYWGRRVPAIIAGQDDGA